MREQRAPGIYYRHDAGAPEERYEQGAHEKQERAWMRAVARVDSRAGGYVERVDADGEVTRRHPAERRW